jgi:hypothetical protein
LGSVASRDSFTRPEARHGAPQQESGLALAQMSTVGLAGEQFACRDIDGAPRRETRLAKAEARHNLFPQPSASPDSWEEQENHNMLLCHRIMQGGDKCTINGLVGSLSIQLMS